ncbi:hypothetical protein SAY86_022473 [Trapa natans]|uniref:Cyclin N-terminal domain-containing protein n=1 Tax=Trapa natans TaxID=22666 RepID=A0AAN7M5L9_TRANT|nr:hypothetical protein SAY86_022473 [Trapa natans]
MKFCSPLPPPPVELTASVISLHLRSRSPFSRSTCAPKPRSFGRRRGEEVSIDRDSFLKQNLFLSVEHEEKLVDSCNRRFDRPDSVNSETATIGASDDLGFFACAGFFSRGFLCEMFVRNRRPSPPADDAGEDATTKRVPLSNITNQRDGGSSASVLSSTSKAHFSAQVVRTEPPVNNFGRSFARTTSSASLDSKLNGDLLAREALLLINEKVPLRAISCPGPKILEVELKTPLISDLPLGNGTIDTSPSCSIDSTSTCETMSTHNSLETPWDCIGGEDTLSTKSTGMANVDRLFTREEAQTPGSIVPREVLFDMEMADKINIMDPRFCATIASEIYEHLHLSEVRRRPLTDFMERVQNDINASMRAVLIDWLVEVSEEYRLVPETLFLAVNYIDRYLSGNPVNRQKLQLLGVTCMMIAAKYEEVSAPQVEDFCYITDSTYCKMEVLQMESLVLSYLKYELTTPTVNCFLRWFVWAAHGFKEVPSVQLECLAQYFAELSLLDYSMLCYAPSIVAASAVFLAKFMLNPKMKPWNSELGCYTLYRPSDLYGCVKALHHLCRSGQNSNVTAVRQKYSQHKYTFVAKKYCPPSIPGNFFED